MFKKTLFLIIPLLLISVILIRGEYALSAQETAAKTISQTAQQSANQQTLFLPIIFNNYVESFLDGITPDGGRCPGGYYLVHSNGTPGIAEPETAVYDDADYLCLPITPADSLSCSPFGEAVLVDGIPSCACETGYVGDACDLCAPGYTFSTTTGQCLAQPPTDEVEFAGNNTSLELGQTRVLTASLPGIAMFDWAIGEGGLGCFDDMAGGCQPEISGPATITFRAPDSLPEGADLALTTIIATPMDSAGGSLPPAATSLILTIPGGIPITGQGHANLQPILTALSDYMYNRCIGAGVIGISFYGKPIGIWGLGRMDGRASLNSRPECGSDTQNPFYPDAPWVQPTTPFRMGSIGKSVTMAIGRQAASQAWEQQNGSWPTHAQVNAIPLVGASNSPLGQPLLPPELEGVYSRQLEVAHVYTTTFGNFADPRWADVTLGNLFGHTSGLQRDGGDDYMRQTVNSLPILRDLLTPQGEIDLTKLAAQQQILVQQYGAQAVTNARNAIAVEANVDTSSVYFIPQPTLGEFINVVAARPLLHEPTDNKYQYTNTGPGYIIIVAEHLTGQPFAAHNGDPASHQGSLLYDFFLNELGVFTTGQSGIFRSHLITPLPGGDPEPRQRIWDASQNTYYPTMWDTKRPHCLLTTDGSDCTFDTWRNETYGRVGWHWQREQVPFFARGVAVNPGSGELVADPGTFLRYLNTYWVGGYGTNPRIGTRRDSGGSMVWNRYTTHNGAWRGSYSWAMQLGSTDAPTVYSLAARTASGQRLANDATQREPNYILAPSRNGMVVSYGADGYPSASFFHEADGLAVGRPDMTGVHKLYVATATHGRVRIYTPGGAEIANYDIGFQEGDRLLVGNLDNDIFDEIVVIKANGAVHVYDHNGAFLRTMNNWVNFVDSDTPVALGRYEDAGPNYFFRASAWGEVLRYATDNLASSVKTGVPYQSGNGMAVGNVLGMFKDEILVADHQTGIVSIYNYSLSSKKYGLVTTFQGYYEPGSQMVINQVASRGFHRNEIIIGQPSTGKIRVFRVSADDDKVVEHIQTLKGVGDIEDLFDAGMFLAVGSVYASGTNTYLCSNADGILRQLPSGVDIHVSVNQWNVDRACAIGDSSQCGAAYNALHNILLHAVCQVNWNIIVPLDEIIVP